MIQEGHVITQGASEYHVGAKIKSGGFGSVFHAKRVKPTPLDVAIKVPGDHVIADPVWSKKFAREARILANINHPNVVKIVAVFPFADGTMALAQELVRGAQHLHEFIKKQPEKASSALAQCLYAMHAFHGNGRDNAAIHRDLSPSNILVDEFGLVKVIDFGLAKENPRLTEILTQADEGFGTHGCIAPEQVNAAADVDHRADLFALGKSFAAALQNRHPLHADVTRLPDPWRTVCSKLCEHEVDDRYDNAASCLSAAFTAFAAAGIELRDFDIHVTEMNRWPVIVDGWPQTCSFYFKSMFDIAQEDLVMASRIERGVFRAKGFDANDFLDNSEMGSAVAAFEQSQAGFDDCDPLGQVYVSIYPGLNADNKLRCFRRLCSVAVGWHRYAVMGNVRDAFGLESDPAMREQLLKVLAEEDPTKTIHGYNVIPGR